MTKEERANYLIEWDDIVKKIGDILNRFLPDVPLETTTPYLIDMLVQTRMCLIEREER